MATIVRSRALLLLAKELGLEHLDVEVLETFAVSATGPRDLILLSIAMSLRGGLRATAKDEALARRAEEGITADR
jgi:hypothetical protein